MDIDKPCRLIDFSAPPPVVRAYTWTKGEAYVLIYVIMLKCRKDVSFFIFLLQVNIYRRQFIHINILKERLRMERHYTYTYTTTLLNY